MRLLIGTLAATTALTLPAFAQTASTMDYTTAICADFIGLAPDEQTMAYDNFLAQATAGMTANADATGTVGDAASTDMTSTETADAGAASTDTGAASTDMATTDTATADAGAASTDMSADTTTTADAGAASSDMATTDTATQTADAGATADAVTGTESTAADTSTGAGSQDDSMLVAILAACEGSPDQLVMDAMMQAQIDMGMTGMETGTGTDMGTAPATE